MNSHVFSWEPPLGVVTTCYYRRRSTITIQEGDTIHHHQHGIGTVVSIRKRSFSGPDGSKFAKLHFTRNDMTMMVREEDLAETVRKPIASNTAQEVFEHIGTWKESVSEQWKPRAAALQKKLDDGSPFALAEVYKTLCMRQKADSLSAADRRQLGQSEARLCEELAMASGRPEDDVLRQMETSALD